jgi:hypothetical protein
MMSVPKPGLKSPEGARVLGRIGGSGRRGGGPPVM